MIAGPGIAKGAEAKSMAEMVDFYPTLAELAELPSPDFVSGVSLAAALQDPSIATRTAALTQYESGYSIRTDRYRYTEWGEAGKDGQRTLRPQQRPSRDEKLGWQRSAS